MVNNRCSVILLDQFDGLYSDYFLAKHLGKKSSYIANIRAGKQHLPNWAVIELAKLGDFKAELWVMWISADRSATDEEHKWWRSYMGEKANKAYALLQGVAASIILGTAIFSASTSKSIAYEETSYSNSYPLCVYQDDALSSRCRRIFACCTIPGVCLTVCGFRLQI